MSQIVIYDQSVVPGSDVEGLIPDSGTSPVLPNAMGYINVLGGSNINTVGSLNTLTINLDNDIFIHDATLTDLTASTAPSDINFIKRRGSLTINSGDGLGNLFFYGYDGTADILSAAMSVVSTGTIGSARIPSQFEWYTTPDTIAPSLTLRMGIPDTGGLVIQNPTSGIGLSVGGGGANINGSSTIVGSLTIEDDNLFITDDDIDTDGREIIFEKSRNGGVITSGDQLGSINFYGNDGTIQSLGSSIEAVTTGTIGADRIPTQLNFYTHPDAVQASPDLQATIDENGILILHQYSSGPLFVDNTGVVSSGSRLAITNLVGLGGSYNVLDSDQYLSCDVSGGTLTINLPNSTLDGRIIRIKDAQGDANTNNITVTTVGGVVTIDGNTSYPMTTNYQSVSIIWNNTDGEYQIFV